MALAWLVTKNDVERIQLQLNASSSQEGGALLNKQPVDVEMRVLHDPLQVLKTPATSLNDIATIKAQISGQSTGINVFNIYRAILKIENDHDQDGIPYPPGIDKTLLVKYKRYLLNKYRNELRGMIYPQFQQTEMTGENAVRFLEGIMSPYMKMESTTTQDTPPPPPPSKETTVGSRAPPEQTPAQSFTPPFAQPPPPSSRDKPFVRTEYRELPDIFAQDPEKVKKLPQFQEETRQRNENKVTNDELNKINDYVRQIKDFTFTNAPWPFRWFQVKSLFPEFIKQVTKKTIRYFTRDEFQAEWVNDQFHKMLTMQPEEEIVVSLDEQTDPEAIDRLIS